MLASRHMCTYQPPILTIWEYVGHVHLHEVTSIMSSHGDDKQPKSQSSRSRSPSSNSEQRVHVSSRNHPELTIQPKELNGLWNAAMNYPAIDNHAHPLLKAGHRDAIPFEHLISEAEGDATKDAVHTLACWRAVRELKSMYKMFWWGEPTWEGIKEERSKMDYEKLCRTFLEPCKIQCVLIDDGLGNPDLVIPYEKHGKWCRSKRIARVEVIAEVCQIGFGKVRVWLIILAPLTGHSAYAIQQQ
jgi:hypothetical protein